MDEETVLLSPDCMGRTRGYKLFHSDGQKGIHLVEELSGVRTFPSSTLNEYKAYSRPFFKLGRGVHPFWESILANVQDDTTPATQFDKLGTEEQEAIVNLRIDEVEWRFEEDNASVDFNETYSGTLTAIRKVIEHFGSFVRNLSHAGYVGAEDYGVNEDNLTKRALLLVELIPTKCKFLESIHLQGDYYGSVGSLLASPDTPSFPAVPTLIIGSWFPSNDVGKVFTSSTCNVRELSICMEDLIHHYSNWNILAQVQTLQLRNLTSDCTTLVNVRRGIPPIMKQFSGLYTLILSNVAGANWQSLVELLNQTKVHCPTLSVLCVDASFLSTPVSDSRNYFLHSFHSLHIYIPNASNDVLKVIKMFTGLNDLHVHAETKEGSETFCVNFPWIFMPDIKQVIDWPSKMLYKNDCSQD